MNNVLDKKFMKAALNEAKKAFLKDEVPIGCVIVYQNKIIARAHNLRQHSKNAIDHAEIIAIKKANKKLGTWQLDDCSIYITLEPCLMCTGAIFQSRIKRVVFAASEPKFGALGSIIDISKIPGFNHQIELIKGIEEEKASELLKTFFQKLRNKQTN